MADATGVVAVFVTMPDVESAEGMGAALVEERLAACANVVHGVTSLFRWEGEVRRETEALMMIKTTGDRADALRARVVELHPHDVPEVVAMDVVSGHAPYLDWVRTEVRGA